MEWNFKFTKSRFNGFGSRIQHVEMEVRWYDIWKWKCGNGDRVSFWYDIWTSDETLGSLFQDLFLLATNRFGKVSEFYVLSPANEFAWRIIFSRNLLSAEKSQLEALFTLLHRIVIQPFVDDVVTWKPTESSTYSTIMAYDVLHQQAQLNNHEWFSFMWTKGVPSEIQGFTWLACHHQTPVKHLLFHKNIILEINHATCSWCDSYTEMADHLLLHCNSSFLFWGSLFRWWNMSWVMPRSILEFVQDMSEGMPTNCCNIWKLIGPYAIWQIWLARNEVALNDRFFCWSKAVNIKQKAFQCAVEQKACNATEYHIWIDNIGIFIEMLVCCIKCSKNVV
ncbi:putative ribonuclease H protein [Tanacetum coccineum]